MRSDIEEWLKGEGERFFTQIGVREGNIILDFGCSQGNYAIPAAKVVRKKGKVYALDKDEANLKELMRRAKSMKLENIEVIKTSGELKIALEDEFLDVVLLYDVLHDYYFSVNERRKILKEIYRILKPDSLLSVYPKHMEIKEIKKEIESENFHIVGKFFKKLIHDGVFIDDYILNFRKIFKEDKIEA